MSPDISVTTTAAAVKIRWADAAAGVFTGRALLKSFRKIGLQLQRTIMLKTSNDVLQKRTGNLSRAIFYRLEGSGRELLVRAGVDLMKAVYGRIHEFGGVIRPVKAKFLTIPLGPNLTANGVARVSAREFINNPESLGFVSSFVNRERTVIFGKDDRGGIEAVFALKDSVTIRPTHYISNSLRQNHSFIQDELKVVAKEIVTEIAHAPTK